LQYLGEPRLQSGSPLPQAGLQLAQPRHNAYVSMTQHTATIDTTSADVRQRALLLHNRGPLNNNAPMQQHRGTPGPGNNTHVCSSFVQATVSNNRIERRFNGNESNREGEDFEDQRNWRTSSSWERYDERLQARHQMHNPEAQTSTFGSDSQQHYNNHVAHANLHHTPRNLHPAFRTPANRLTTPANQGYIFSTTPKAIPGGEAGEAYIREREMYEQQHIPVDETVHDRITYLPTPFNPTDRQPPSLLRSRLADKNFSAALKVTYGDPHKFEEEFKKAVDKAVYVDYYMKTTLAYAHDAIIDPCLLILNKLSAVNQQWFLNLLRTKSYHTWSAFHFEQLKLAFRNRFGGQQRSDKAVALSEWAEGMQMKDSDLPSEFADKVTTLARRCGTIPMPMQINLFLKGLPPRLKALCLQDPNGDEWEDWHALTTYVEAKARIEHQLQMLASTPLVATSTPIYPNPTPSKPAHPYPYRPKKQHLFTMSATPATQSNTLPNKATRTQIPVDPILVTRPVTSCPHHGWGATKEVDGVLTKQAPIIPEGEILQSLGSYGICFSCRGLIGDGRHLSREGKRMRCPWRDMVTGPRAAQYAGASGAGPPGPPTQGVKRQQEIQGDRGGQ
jgi:hypothetical protein